MLQRAGPRRKMLQKRLLDFWKKCCSSRKLVNADKFEGGRGNWRLRITSVDSLGAISRSFTSTLSSQMVVKTSEGWSNVANIHGDTAPQWSKVILGIPSSYKRRIFYGNISFWILQDNSGYVFYNQNFGGNCDLLEKKNCTLTGEILHICKGDIQKANILLKVDVRFYQSLAHPLVLAIRMLLSK